MANPTTTYTSGFPDIIWPGNLKEERSLQQNVLFQRARDYNIHDQEICQIQAYLGAHPVQGWVVGDTTVNDRITQIGGTGGCWEGGTICDYSGPEGVDPQQTGFINTTGSVLGPGYIGGTGSLFGNPTTIPGGPAGWFNQPINPQPAPFGPCGANWVWNPQGGGFGGFGGAGAPFPMPYPDAVPPTTDDTWTSLEWIQYVQFLAQNAMYLIQTKSSLDTMAMPNVYADVLPFFRDLADFIDNWPRGRTNPENRHEEGVLSQFDWQYAAAGILKQVTETMGIQWYDGTISADGTNISFTTTDPFNTGHANASADKLVILAANTGDSAFGTSNISGLVTFPGLSNVLGQGLQAAGSFAVTLTVAAGATYRPGGATEADVKVGVYTGRPHLSVGGDPTTMISENILGGAGVFTPTVSAANFADGDQLAEPNFMVYDKTNGVMLAYTSGAPSSGEWGISGANISTNAADSATEIHIFGQLVPTVTS